MGAGSSKPLPYVKVPKTYDAFCTSRVLVLEYVAGIKISDVDTIDATEGAAGRVYETPKESAFFSRRASRGTTGPMAKTTPGLDRKLIAERLTTLYLEQLCRHGFFHCDTRGIQTTDL